MNIEFTKKFEKQIDKLNDNKVIKEVSKCVKDVINANNIDEIKNIKKLKGEYNAYRIRIGNYRIGVFFEEIIKYYFLFFCIEKIFINVSHR